MSDGNMEQAGLPLVKAALNNMPPEIILQIFYQLCYVINNGKGHDVRTTPCVTSMAELNQIATVSKHVYQCFKDSEFAIFRRLVHWSLFDNANVPGFADLVIKIGGLKFMEGRPTDPDKIKNILQGVQRDEWRRRIRRNFTPEVRVELHSKHYDGVLAWLASRFTFRTHADDRWRRHNVTDARARGVPDSTFIAHPFDVLYPLSAGYAVPVMPKSERVEFYISTLLEEAERWKDHIETPWTQEETEYFDSDRGLGIFPARPCCLAKDCPRRPHGPNHAAASRLINALVAWQGFGSVIWPAEE